MPPETYDSFISSPLSSWIESTLGLSEQPETKRLIRSTPSPVSGEGSAAKQLSDLTGLNLNRCEKAIRRHLLAGYRHRDHLNRPVFAFRLHQFISKGEAVYASLEREDARHITLQPQKWVPGSNRQKRLVDSMMDSCLRRNDIVAQE